MISWPILMLLPALPALVIIVFFWSKWKVDHDLYGILTSLIFFIATLGIYFAWKVNIYYGIVHAVLSYVGIIGFNLRALGKIDVTYALIALALSVVTTITVVPIGVLPTFRAEYALSIPEDKLKGEIDLDFVAKSLEGIEQAISDASVSIQAEQTKVNDASKQLMKSLQVRNEQLRALRKQYKDLLQEVEQYKVLATLTEPQAEAVHAALNRGKYLDYIIGFFIGLLSSASVAFTLRLLKQKQP